MKLLKFMLALLIGSAFIITSCQNDSEAFLPKNDTLNNIPNDGSIASVTGIDIASLMDKMDFDYVKNLEVYQDMIKEASKENEVIAKVMSDPKSSGIDLRKSIYFANSVDDKNIGDVFNYASASIDDIDAFEKMLNASDLGEVQSMEGFKMIKMGRKGVVAWNDEMAVAGNATGYMDIPDLVTKIFSTTKENSIVKNKNLRKSFSANHDINSWVSSNAYANNPDVQMGSGMINIDAEALKDNFVHSYLDFEDGLVEGKSKFFLQKGLTKDLDLFFKDEVETNFNKLTPTENLVFQMSAALDTKGIKQVLAERPQLKSFGNFAMKKYGLTVDDMLKAFGGDLSVAGYASENEDDTDGLFMTNIGDKELFDKLVEAGEDFGVLTQTGDNLYAIDKQLTNSASGGKLDVGNLFLKDDIAYITDNEVLTDKILSGSFKTNKGLGNKTSAMMNDNIFSAALDFTSMKKYTENMENFEGTDLEVTANRKQADMKLEMEDKKTNSLKQLFDMMNKEYVKDKNKKKGRKST